MADNPETPDDDDRDLPEPDVDAPQADANELREDIEGAVDDEDVAVGPPSMGPDDPTTPAGADDRPDGAGRTEPTTAYPQAGEGRPARGGALDPTAPARDGALDDMDETARTVVGVPVGRSGLNPRDVAEGRGVQPPEPPVEASTYEIVYSPISGFVGARDEPDGELRPLATNTTTLEVTGEGIASVETDRTETTVTARRGRGYELDVNISERYADRDSDTGGTKALIEIVESSRNQPPGDSQGPEGRPGEGVGREGGGGGRPERG